MSVQHTELKLPALQGSSLLGFMAALGVFHTLANKPEFSAIRMKWIPYGGSFCPVLKLPAELDDESLLVHLYDSLAAIAGHQAITFDKDLKVTQKVFRNLSSELADAYLNGSDSFGCAMVAAFGCDGVSNEEGHIEDTAFRTMSGAGHQHFLEFMNELAKQTNLEHLREALFGPWRYRDPSPIMRWDDADDRRYALRWDEPSKDPVRTVRGANRLAIAALPLFSVVPISSSGVATTAFKGRKSNDTFITWPIWSGWLSVETIRSALSLQDLQNTTIQDEYLRAQGICAVFRSQRITLGKYRNFTPAKAI